MKPFCGLRQTFISENQALTVILTSFLFPVEGKNVSMKWMKLLIFAVFATKHLKPWHYLSSKSWVAVSSWVLFSIRHVTIRLHTCLLKKAIMCHNIYQKFGIVKARSGLIYFNKKIAKTAKNMKNHNDKQMLFWGRMIDAAGQAVSYTLCQRAYQSANWARSWRETAVTIFFCIFKTFKMMSPSVSWNDNEHKEYLVISNQWLIINRCCGMFYWNEKK